MIRQPTHELEHFAGCLPASVGVRFKEPSGLILLAMKQMLELEETFLRKPRTARDTTEQSFLLPINTRFALADPRWGRLAAMKRPGRSAPDRLEERGLRRSA
jgi:hypothetical protein